MAAKLLDGKKLAEEVRVGLGPRVRALAELGVVPGLAVLLVGEDPASVSYVTAKEKACADLGMRSTEVRLPATAGEDDILAVVRRFNADPSVHGILVQLPLPKGVSEARVIEEISPEKDVDGFTPVNVGRMVIGEPCFLPCTPHGVLKLIEVSGIRTAGAHAVVVGRSNIVGKPLATLLARKSVNATVTVCHTGTRDLAEHTRRADILIACAGTPELIKADMVKPGACVIDVGVNRVDDPSKAKGWRLVGDVDFEAVKEVAGSITPVPGGVGPMTITMLLYNTVESAERARARA
ncbi:MAG: bifunctional methylenetetrahydrofolate dehydrogenase/methenyltetrahydrofolate cyclohydrolase FolD [Spirochaetaceae bacterium]|nr:bifunctional methylenetetrahydrofolate dehydrogenase/methenyltetrahydrofolate cyclohydrolase FolD [Spirochaetaceae bacterium]HPE89914.1 bifunctional methylenetetrahydrofolate dehydrogenase/methenyltetrahydrofolate cyclohydrolase FolD [Spirochaetales bacterium]